jgi:hypothetical protein
MKKLIFCIVLINIALTSFGQRKNDILKEIYDYRKSIVSVATFDKKEADVWNAIYVIATEEYNTIVRESESKGYIEAKQESDTYRGSITIEIRGDAAPYRVSFQVKKEIRIKKEDGTYTNWGSGGSASDAYMTKLQLRLYELLNGTLKLSKELQDKVDKFNSLQTKDRKKIVKGKDY